MSSHACRYRETLAWSEWEASGSLRHRSARRVPVCVECGKERPARHARPERRVQEEQPKRTAAPLSDPEGRKVAQSLLRKAHSSRPVPAKGLLGELRASGIAESVTEDRLRRFLESGWVRLTWDVHGPVRKLTEVLANQIDDLEEYAWPGRRKDVDQALEDARRQIAALSHPIAEAVGRLLDESEFRKSSALIRSLAGVATHVDRGDVLAARVFSSRYLGDSKAVERLRGALERGLGPLEELGIRKGASLCLLGGKGTVVLKDCSITLRGVGPFLGLTAEVLEAAEGLEFPPGGMLVVENLAVFEACCRLEAGDCPDAMVVWSGGYPGRAVRGLVAAAVKAECRIRVWADLDLDGVRISRLLAPAEPYRMGPEEVEAASVRKPLTSRAREAIRADLVERPEASLVDTLKKLLESDWWVEQEALL